MAKITVVIPHRTGSDCRLTLKSLGEQTFKDFVIVKVEDVDKKGANWARNEGFKQVKTPYVLFSDDDIYWEVDALESMLDTLEHSNASFCYGDYNLVLPFSVVPHKAGEFSKERLIDFNFASTMSLIKTEDFPGFDETIERFQDWELWLNMVLIHNKTGIYCPKLLFNTPYRPGITFGDEMSVNNRINIIRNKYKI
jgi:glycosyltransferase involved in cell wall biosynthesis